MELIKAVGLILFLYLVSASGRAEPSLAQAIEQGDISQFLSLLEQGDPTELKQQLPLLLPQLSQSSLSDEQLLLITQQLLRHGVPVNSKDKEGKTLLTHTAITSCHECVRLLVESGANIDESSKSGETPLLLAVHRANLETVRLLIQFGANVQVKNQKSEGLLHLALAPVKQGTEKQEQRAIRTEIVSLLLKQGLSADERAGEFSYSPLHYAARNNYPEAMQLLMEHGAKKDGETLHGVTPLMLAVRGGHLDFIKAFLAYKPDLNKLSDSESGAIHYTVQRNKRVEDSVRAEMIQLLVQAGAEIDLTNKYGCTALSGAANKNFLMAAEVLIKLGAHVEAECDTTYTPLFYAVFKGHQDMVKLLLGHSAKPNAQNAKGVTPLHISADRNQLEIAALLLKAGADLNAQGQDGRTPLLRAVYRRHTAMVQLLVERGADVNLANYRGWTPLHLLVIKKKSKTQEKTDNQEELAKLVTLLMNAGALPNELNDKKMTPLLIATANNQVQAAKALLEAGADVDFRADDKQTTPLLMAVFKGSVEMVQTLLAYSPSLSVTSGREDWPPLIAASGTRDGKYAERAEITQLLLNAGADPSATLASGRTALMNAAEENKLEVVQVLIEYGVNPNLRNSLDGNKTALDYARKLGHQKIIEYLQPVTVE